MGEIDQAQGSLNVWENLVIYFFSIWSIMKVYINYCMLGKISLFGKIPVPEIWPKMLNCRIFKSNISLEYDTNSLKLKVV